jgi:hypothetical protein
MNRRRALAAAIAAIAGRGSAMTKSSATTLEGDGIVMVKSAHPFNETVERSRPTSPTRR